MIRYVVLGILSVHTAFAVGIHTNVALPVAKGQGVLRLKNSLLIPATSGAITPALAYGITPNLALLTALPIHLSSANSGFKDVPVTSRYTFIKSDSYQSTSRLASLLGVTVPLGKVGISTGSWAAQAGAVYTLQSGRHELDLSSVYKTFFRSNGQKPGDVITYDLAYQTRIFPWELPEKGNPAWWNIDIEINGIHQSKTGSTATGGNFLYLSPGVQWISEDLVIETLYRIVVVQNPNAGAPKRSDEVVLSFRIHI